MADRFDRTTFQIQPHEDLKVYQQRVNEMMAKLSSELNRLAGVGGPSTTQDSANIHTDGYTFMDLDSSLGAKASFSSNNDPTNKKFYVAYGAKRATDGSWIATSKTSVIQEFSDAGLVNYYVNSGLVVGQVFTPTSGSPLSASQVAVIPSGDLAATNVQAALNELDTEKQILLIPSCRVCNNSNQSVTGNSYHPLSFTTELWDTHGIHESVTNPTRFTVPSGWAGSWLMGGHCQTPATGTSYLLGVMLNGNYIYGFDREGVAGSQTSVATLLKLAVGDYVELVLYTAGAGTHTVVSNAGTSSLAEAHYTPEFWAQWMSPA